MTLSPQAPETVVQELLPLACMLWLDARVMHWAPQPAHRSLGPQSSNGTVCVADVVACVGLGDAVAAEPASLGRGEDGGGEVRQSLRSARDAALQLRALGALLHLCDCVGHLEHDVLQAVEFDLRGILVSVHFTSARALHDLLVMLGRHDAV